MPRLSARSVALLLALVLLFYAVVVGDRGVVLVRTGEPVAVLLGIGVLLLPVVGVWLAVLELRFGRDSERLARRLEAEGGLPVDDLPRRPSGRVDLAAADAEFERRRREVEAAPEDWRPWYRLAVAYGDARDTRRGRSAMRRAIALERADRSTEVSSGGRPPRC